MYCPKCRSEFRDDITRCANCDLDLIAELPDEDPFSSPEKMAAMIGDREVEAIVVGPYMALRDVQNELSRARIPSVIAGEADDVEAGLQTRFFLMIPADQKENARQFFAEQWKEGIATEGIMLKDDTLEALVADEETGAIPCPACETPVPVATEECPECGLVVGGA